jgi:hypothetical protein
MKQIAANVVAQVTVSIVFLVIVLLAAYFGRFELCRLIVGTSGANLEFCREENTEAQATQIVQVTQVIPVTQIAQVTQVVVPATPVPVTESSTPAFDSTFIANANKSCDEFGGQPVSAITLTDEQVQRWRSIGQTNSNDEVGKVIYCEVHQIPGFKGFVEGDTIPANAIITADLGYNWNAQYVGALERLVYYDGGWGVFLSIKSFTVQHASDLPNRIGGQYWIIK